MNRPSWIAFAVAVLLAAAAGFLAGKAGPSEPLPAAPAPSPPPPPAVAIWSGGALTAAQLQARVSALKAAAGLSALEPARARAFADEAIRTAVLATEARSRGLAGDARVEGPVASLLAQRLLELELEDPARRPPLSDAEVSAWYDANKEEFQRPARAHFFELAGRAPRSDAAARKKVRAELESLKKQLAALPMEDAAKRFSELARKRSDDPETAARGGDLGLRSLAQLEERFGSAGAQAAWLMVAVGQLELVESDAAIHLLRLVDRSPERAISLADARPQIESRIWYERRDVAQQAFLEALTRKLSLQVDQDALERALKDVK